MFRSLRVVCVAVYYLKATFGPYTDDAVLEIPVSVTGNKSLIIYYQISSSKIELAVLQRKASSTTMSMVLKYTNQQYFDEWNEGVLGLDSDVEAVQLVARKTGVTMNVEYVLVDAVEIVLSNGTGSGTGNMLLSHCRSAVFAIENVLFRHDAIPKRTSSMLTCNNAIQSSRPSLSQSYFLHLWDPNLF